MHIYEVGKLYFPTRKNWPELAQYNFRGGEHELVLFFGKPTLSEIRDVQKGEAEFALFVERSLIVMLYRFGHGVDWSDAPYSIHLVQPQEDRILPPEVVDAGVILNIVLVDASTGIIKALRAISMPPGFTQPLHKAIREQAAMPFTRAAYNGELESLYKGYPSEILARMAPVHFKSRP